MLQYVQMCLYFQKTLNIEIGIYCVVACRLIILYAADIMGVVKNVSPTRTKKTKFDKRKSTSVRNVDLVDRSLKKLSMTLWGKEVICFRMSVYGLDRGISLVVG